MDHSPSHRGNTRTIAMQVRANCLFLVAAAVIFGLWCHSAHALQTQINKLVYNYDGLGGYSFEFKTSDGTYRREDGGLVSDLEGEGMVVRGEYGYIDPLGRLYTVRYIADRNGYQPQYPNVNTRFNDRRIV